MSMYPVREPGNEYVPSQGAWEWVCTLSGEPGKEYVSSKYRPGNGYVPSQGSLAMSMLIEAWG